MLKRLHLTALAAVAICAPVAAFAQASGDGFQGPRIFGDSALDKALIATNRELQQSYARKDTINGLVTRPAPDFVTLATARLAEAETEADDADATGLPVASFADQVGGDASLDAKLAGLNRTLADADTHLFVVLARLAGDDLDDRLDDADLTVSSFGPSIDGDATLQAKVVHVTDLIAPAASDRVQPTAAPVPPFTDASLERYATALTTPPTDL